MAGRPLVAVARRDAGRGGLSGGTRASEQLARVEEPQRVEGGLDAALHLDAHLGQKVSDGERLGTLFDSFGKTLRAVYANRDGIVIGRTEAPLVNSGDAVVHIAG